MAFNFEYIGYKKGGGQARGNIVAADRDNAIRKLGEEGITVDRIFVKFSNKKIESVAEEKPKEEKQAEAKSAKGASMDFSQMSQNKYARAIAVVVVVFLVIVWFVMTGGPLRIEHHVVKLEDLSDGQNAVKAFYVVVNKDVTERQIKKVAMNLFKSGREGNSNLVAAKYLFFYPDQKRVESRAIAVLKFNFSGFAAWDEEYSIPKLEK